MPRRKQPAIPDEVLDQLLGGSDPRAALAEGGLLDGLKKALVERGSVGNSVCGTALIR